MTRPSRSMATPFISSLRKTPPTLSGVITTLPLSVNLLVLSLPRRRLVPILRVVPRRLSSLPPLRITPPLMSMVSITLSTLLLRTLSLMPLALPTALPLLLRFSMTNSESLRVSWPPSTPPPLLNSLSMDLPRVERTGELEELPVPTSSPLLLVLPRLSASSSPSSRASSLVWPSEFPPSTSPLLISPSSSRSPPLTLTSLKPSEKPLRMNLRYY